MPIRWYGPADPTDPTYRHYERIVNLCLHGGVFAAVASGLWVVEGLAHPWPEPVLTAITGGWGAAWLIHLLLVILRRPRSAQESPS